MRNDKEETEMPLGRVDDRTPSTLGYVQFVLHNRFGPPGSPPRRTATYAAFVFGKASDADTTFSSALARELACTTTRAD